MPLCYTNMPMLITYISILHASENSEAYIYIHVYTYIYNYIVNICTHHKHSCAGISEKYTVMFQTYQLKILRSGIFSKKPL